MIIAVGPERKCLSAKTASGLHFGDFGLPGMHRRCHFVNTVCKTQVLEQVVFSMECSERLRFHYAVGNVMRIEMSVGGVR